ncbi:MAG: cytochrome C [Gammaproteobacteria bacterium]|nr:cytochrome C [Gammaproteobacteria bacterium]
MMNKTKQITLFLVVTFILIFISTANAKPPRTEKQIKQEEKMMLDAVAMGDALWHDPKMGTNGLGCANCHPDGSASNPHTFPKYQSNLGKVGTLREMINWCISVVLQGTPLPLDSEKMIAMEAYATYTHRGVMISPAKDEQHGAVPVKSGPGYP